MAKLARFIRLYEIDTEISARCIYGRGIMNECLEFERYFNNQSPTQTKINNFVLIDMYIECHEMKIFGSEQTNHMHFYAYYDI